MRRTTVSSSSPVEPQNVTRTSGLPSIMPEAESAVQNDTAISRVFGTDELLLLVLESVPVRDRLPLLRVSRKWNSIISSIGCAVVPAFTGIDRCEDTRRFIRSGAPGPRYVIDGTMRINPAINSSAAAAPFFDGITFINESIRYRGKVLPLLPLMGITVMLESIHDSSKLSSKRDEFITSPPITMIMLGSRSQLSNIPEVNNHTSAAMLSENTGIRIGHLLDSLEKMQKNVLQAYHQGLRWPEPAANSALHQPLAFFHYSGHVLVTFPEGVKTNFKTQCTGLPSWWSSEDQGDNESNTQDGGEDEIDGSGKDENNDSGEVEDEDSSEDGNDSGEEGD